MGESRSNGRAAAVNPALRIACLGGGPGGLYAAILMKKLDPRHEITVYERNAPGVTFGWGVVFSAETLGNLAEADPESYARIESEFKYWDDIDAYVADTVVNSTGHGFCGFARGTLLQILEARCRELGVELRFEHEIADESEIGDVDLIIAADGANSAVRKRLADHFKPEIDGRDNRFTWLGTTRPMDSFVFIFRQTEFGLFMAHAYPYEDGLGTFIVECSAETWRAAGLHTATESETVEICGRIFANWLDAHPLMSNRSIWRDFSTVRCATWHHDNLVIIGDAAHTAHFSVGSGTKLAMEDAIELAEAFRTVGTDDVPAALEAYETARWVEVAKVQKAAQTSLEWFESVERYLDQDPILFTFNLLTRSKRITYDNLALRDPAFIARVREAYADHVGMPRSTDESAPPPIFAPFEMAGLSLVNRIVVSPMCQYVARDGVPDDWHLVHLGSRAVGGAGLVFTEMTDVSPEARITPGCTGIWNDEQAAAWRRIVEFVHAHSKAKIAMQLGHAGRKGATCVPWEGGSDEPLAQGEWEIIAPSPLPYFDHSRIPRAMDRADMDRVIDDHASAARRAASAGFDMLEIHMAHGYLLATFISPLTNLRDDDYGGPIERRMRFPLDVLDAVRAAWPEGKPISVRISATDWAPGGTTGDDAVAIARLLKAHGCAVIDASAGQTVPYANPNYGRMFQVPWGDRIRHEVGIPTISVGAIEDADHANTVLAAGRADLTALARPHLFDPYLTLHEAARYAYWDQEWPSPYLTVRPRRPRQGVLKRPLPPREVGEAGSGRRRLTETEGS